MAIKVVHIKKEAYDVYIGRGSIFGNPYTHLSLNNTMAKFHVSSREEAIEKYKEYLYAKIIEDNKFLTELLKLKNKTLGCFCKPKSCHGDVIKELLDNTES